MYALQDPKYKFPQDFVYFCGVDIDDSCVFVRKGSPFRTIEDVVAEAKKRPLTTAGSRLPHPASIGVLALGDATGAKFRRDHPVEGGRGAGSHRRLGRDRRGAADFSPALVADRVDGVHRPDHRHHPQGRGQYRGLRRLPAVPDVFENPAPLSHWPPRRRDWVLLAASILLPYVRARRAGARITGNDTAA